MQFERHSRGKVFGQVEICPDSYLCPQSHAEGSADIWQSRIERSRIRFDSKIRQSVVTDLSTVGSENGKCEVMRCLLERVSFYGGTALNCYINNSLIEGGYFRGAGRGVTIIDSIIKDEVRLEGEAMVIGVTLEKQMRISEGVWTRQPRYIEIDNDIAHVGITEGLNGYAHIACNYRPMSKWIKKRNLWQKAVGWSTEMTNQIVLTFEEWMDCPVGVENV